MESIQNECSLWYLTMITIELEYWNNTQAKPTFFPEPAQPQTEHEKELCVYARRNKPQEVIEIPNLPEQSRESEPISGNSGNKVVDEHTDNDLDMPTAIRVFVNAQKTLFTTLYLMLAYLQYSELLLLIWLTLNFHKISIQLLANKNGESLLKLK